MSYLSPLNDPIILRSTYLFCKSLYTIISIIINININFFVSCFLLLLFLGIASILGIQCYGTS